MLHLIISLLISHFLCVHFLLLLFRFFSGLSLVSLLFTPIHLLFKLISYCCYDFYFHFLPSFSLGVFRPPPLFCIFPHAFYSFSSSTLFRLIILFKLSSSSFYSSSSYFPSSYSSFIPCSSPSSCPDPSLSFSFFPSLSFLPPSLFLFLLSPPPPLRPAQYEGRG